MIEAMADALFQCWLWIIAGSCIGVLWSAERKRRLKNRINRQVERKMQLVDVFYPHVARGRPLDTRGPRKAVPK